MAKNKEISIVFEKAKDAKTVPITGAYGGPSPSQQNIVVHFYSEYNTIPHSSTHKVDETGVADVSKGEQISRGDVTREILFTAIMTPQQAASIGEWLRDKGITLMSGTGNK